MLYKSTSLKGYTLNGLDGDIGKVIEFYFDDFYWTVRYLVADTGHWLSGKQVLISPRSLVAVNPEEQSITIDLTKKQIGDSPSLESDKPVSSQIEKIQFEYNGLEIYWNDPNHMGPDPNDEQDPEKSGVSVQKKETWDPNLRSMNEVKGFFIQATDGEIGNVEDFVIDDNTWVVRYLVIDTRNLRPGRMILVSPQWIRNVFWTDSIIFLKLPIDLVQNSPEYSEEISITPLLEAELHKHYKRPDDQPS